MDRVITHSFKGELKFDLLHPGIVEHILRVVDVLACIL
jgi:hypothetical protein